MGAVWRCLAFGGGSLLVLFLVACGGSSVKEISDVELGSVFGRLAVASSSTGQTSSGLTAWQAFGQKQQPLSFDQVSVDLLQQQEGDMPPDNWPVLQSATPDATGSFAFEDLDQGEYALRLNQPEFVDLAYRVDSTEFHLDAGQTITLVLPLVTTITHRLMNPDVPWDPNQDFAPAAALDPDSGEIVLTSNLGFAVVDPDRKKMDLISSRNFFLGVEKGDFGWEMPGCRVLALAPNTRIAWLLYPDRLMRIDRSLFTDPDASEVHDLDALDVRQSVGDKFRFHILLYEENAPKAQWSGEVYFSPDEKILYACTQNMGVVVFDLERMEIARVILGQALGYNPVSNHLFFTNGDYGQYNGTDLLVVDASTFLEVSSAPLSNVLGVAPVPGSAETILIRSQQSSSDEKIPFVVVVEGSGNVTSDERARDYLGLEEDPAAGAPSFDLSGGYFMIGSAAFRVLEGGGYEAVPVGVPPGHSFMERMQCNGKRAVDPAKLFEIWYGGTCQESNAVGLISLDQTSVPVAVRPGTPIREVLLDRERGRAIFSGFDRLVIVHYADPAAAGSDELTDLSSVVGPFVAPGATCSEAMPCGANELCAGMTDTAYTGQCMPNGRRPYRPFCGGFGGAVCEEDFACELQNPTNPNSVGECIGYPSRDHEAQGPACSAELPCPTGMGCNEGGRCEPKTCLFDEDCEAFPGEICGLVAKIGRVCLAPGLLEDGAACLDAGECLHGACVGLIGAAEMGDTEVLHGARGLQACTTPCFQNADCPDGDGCFYSRPRRLDELGGGGNGGMLWKIHHEQVMPYCRPPNLAEPAGCADCLPEELCTMNPAGGGICQVGFDPHVIEKTATGETIGCLPPAEACAHPQPCQDGTNLGHWCLYPCLVSGDCQVFPAACTSGGCISGSRCGSSCGPEQSCAWFGLEDGWCMAAESCRSDADCGGTGGSCILGVCIGPLRTCFSGADCLEGEECVRGEEGWPWWQNSCLPAICDCEGADASLMLCEPDTGNCVRSCAKASECADGEECIGTDWSGHYCGEAQCGCTGPLAGDMVCDSDTGQCVAPPRPCSSASNCLAGEECLGTEGTGYNCGVAQCGCTGPLAGDMVCDLVEGTCMLPGVCTDVPCDGSVDPVCIPTAPDPPLFNCDCPNCDWETCFGMSTPMPLCPAGFVCMDLGVSAMPHVGRGCGCNSTDCQLP